MRPEANDATTTTAPQRGPQAEPLLPGPSPSPAASQCSGIEIDIGRRIGRAFRNPFARATQSRKPFLSLTHQAPILLAITAGGIFLHILFEVLSCRSAKNGGIRFAEDGESLGPGLELVYIYPRTIIAVIDSITWSWIDLDVKRLESFFQMYKPGDAFGRDSVLLSYPVDFLALVPYKATKRKHWTVAAAETSMCLIFWVITPLQVWGFPDRSAHWV